MRASWSALHTSLIRTLNLRSSQADFQAMSQADPELAAFGFIPSLLEHQHARDGDPAGRFAVIRSLVTAAQSGQRYRPTAHLMVIVALWPGLDAVFWRLSRGFPDRRDDLPAEIVGRIGEVILTLDLDRVTSVTSTLLRNVERDIRRDLVAARVVCETLKSIDDPVTEALFAETLEAVSRHPRDLADHLASLAQRDATLLQRVFVLGETQEEAGRALGLRPETARKRYQRALAKLRAQQKIPPVLSHSGSPVGL